MPAIGCLGGNDENSKSVNLPQMDTIITSSILNCGDQFAFLQQTLLLQIFKTCQFKGKVSSPSSSLNCPTCVPFSNVCCQIDSGFDIFQDFIEAQQCFVWDDGLKQSVSSLRYQGYICPGILVVIASSSDLAKVADAWKRHLLTAPESCTISQVGFSNGCTVKPVVQKTRPSLADILCIILFRLKINNITADLDTICDTIKQDWSTTCTVQEPAQESVHVCLGQLIKRRLVYYTGKGYFLVSQDKAPTIGKFTRFRKSLRRSRSSSLTPRSNHVAHKECQTVIYGVDKISPDSSGDSLSLAFVGLERTQSLRFSKKSVRSTSVSKGGSLRLSKKKLSLSKSSTSEEEKVEQEVEEEVVDQPHLMLERKNSFLGKLFSKKTKSRRAIPIELGTFSAQFPPLDDVPPLVPTYSTVIRHATAPQTCSSPQRTAAFSSPQYSIYSDMYPSYATPISSNRSQLDDSLYRKSMKPTQIPKSSSEMLYEPVRSRVIPTNGPQIRSQSGAVKNNGFTTPPSDTARTPPKKSPPLISRSGVYRDSRRRLLVDTIHRTHVAHEVIYEVEDAVDVPQTMARVADSTTPGETPLTFTSVADLTSVEEISASDDAFKSLTAQKLLAGLSFNSIDTLLEVNAVAEARNQCLNTSTETVDFGVI